MYGIEPQSHGPLVNNLTVMPMVIVFDDMGVLVYDGLLQLYFKCLLVFL